MTVLSPGPHAPRRRAGPRRAPAFAQTYSQTVFFGDSLTDSGYFRPLLVQAGGPRPRDRPVHHQPGLVWSRVPGRLLRHQRRAERQRQGGTNYAVGGARVGTDSVGALGPIPSLGTQINTYLAAQRRRAPIRMRCTPSGAAPTTCSRSPATAPGAGDHRRARSTAQVGIVGALQNAGARYILVPTVPDLGLTPSFRAGGPAGAGAGHRAVDGLQHRAVRRPGRGRACA